MSDIVGLDPRTACAAYGEVNVGDNARPCVAQTWYWYAPSSPDVRVPDFELWRQWPSLREEWDVLKRLGMYRDAHSRLQRQADAALQDLRHGEALAKAGDVPLGHTAEWPLIPGVDYDPQDIPF